MKSEKLKVRLDIPGRNTSLEKKKKHPATQKCRGEFREGKRFSDKIIG